MSKLINITVNFCFLRWGGTSLTVVVVLCVSALMVALHSIELGMELRQKSPEIECHNEVVQLRDLLDSSLGPADRHRYRMLGCLSRLTSPVLEVVAALHH